LFLTPVLYVKQGPSELTCNADQNQSSIKKTLKVDPKRQTFYELTQNYYYFIYLFIYLFLIDGEGGERGVG